MVVDSTFDPSVNKAVEAIVVGTDKVFIGGSFKQINGKDRLRLAAFNFDGTLSTWAPSANAVVRSLAMAPDGNSMFVGGLFTTVDGQSRQSVARVDLVNGAINSWAIPPGVINNPQTAWAIVPRGNRVYIGFGHGPNYLASFRLDNGNFGTQLWRINTVGNVESLALNTAGTTLFAGGHFGTAALQQQVCGTPVPARADLAPDPVTGAISCSWLPQLEPHGANFTGAWCMRSPTPSSGRRVLHLRERRRRPRPRPLHALTHAGRAVRPVESDAPPSCALFEPTSSAPFIDRMTPVPGLHFRGQREVTRDV